MPLRLPMSRIVGWWVNSANHLIALYVLLCLCTLLAASGPHLVHHLLVPAWQDSYHAHRSPDCLVLSAVTHTPAEEGGVLPCPILLTSKERLRFVLFRRIFTASLPTFEARTLPP